MDWLTLSNGGDGDDQTLAASSSYLSSNPGIIPDSVDLKLQRQEPSVVHLQYDRDEMNGQAQDAEPFSPPNE